MRLRRGQLSKRHRAVHAKWNGYRRRLCRHRISVGALSLSDEFRRHAGLSRFRISLRGSMRFRQRCRPRQPARRSQLRTLARASPPTAPPERMEHNRRVHLCFGQPDRTVGRAFKTIFGWNVAITVANHFAFRDADGSRARRRSGQRDSEAAMDLFGGSAGRRLRAQRISSGGIELDGHRQWAGLLDRRPGKPAHRRRFDQVQYTGTWASEGGNYSGGHSLHERAWIER
jgi:hypothetical protein